MGVIGRVLKAIALAIRRVVWLIVDGVLRPVARTVDAVAGGVWSGLRDAFRRDPIETEEIVDDGQKAQADAEAAKAVADAAIRALTPGQRVIEACSLRRAGRSIEHLFDRTDPRQADLLRWVRRLPDETIDRVLRIHHTALDRHLDPDHAHRLDLPAPEAIRRRAALVASDLRAEAERKEAARPDGEAAKRAYIERRRAGRGRHREGALPAPRMQA